MRLIRRRYKLGMPGLIYIGITLLLGLGALNSDNNLLFLAFGFAAAGIVASGVVSGAMLMGVRVTRRTPSYASVGQALPLVYTVTSKSRLMPTFGLLLEEASASLKGVKPNWRRHLPRPRAFVAHVGRLDHVHARALVVPTRRGVCRLTGIRGSTAFPFGIFRKSFVIAGSATIEVYPEIRPLRRDLVRTALARGTFNASASNRRGIGDEFYGLREYRPGDSLRHVAWRASAKRGEIVIREHLSTISGELWLVLDLNATGPDRRAKDRRTEQAISLVASLAVDALAQSMSVGLISPNHGRISEKSSGARHRRELLSMLAKIEPVDARASTRLDDHGIARLVQRAPCLVVHAGDLDPSVGPAGASHLTSDDLDRLSISVDQAESVAGQTQVATAPAGEEVGA